MQRRTAAQSGQTVNKMDVAANALRGVAGSGQTVVGRAASLAASLPAVAPAAKALGAAALVYAVSRTLAKAADVGLGAAAGIPDISDSPVFQSLRKQVQDVAFAFTKFENRVTSRSEER